MKTLCAFYDLAVGPVSYDFVVFAVQAEMQRRKIGADRLHFVIVPDAEFYFRRKPGIYSEMEARWRLWNIVIPAVNLLGASCTLAENWAHAEAFSTSLVWPEDFDSQTLKRRHHLIGGVISRHAAGETVPILSATPFAREIVRGRYAKSREAGKRVVTMTMRSTYLPGRNSNEVDWLGAAERITKRGCDVFLILDTSTALRNGGGYAELSLDLRMAMYQEADLNLQANNGAASLCWFGEKPYRMFGAGDEHWDGLFVQQGLPLGETWRWARKEQKLCYGRETMETIVAEFEYWRSTSGL